MSFGGNDFQTWVLVTMVTRQEIIWGNTPLVSKISERRGPGARASLAHSMHWKKVKETGVGKEENMIKCMKDFQGPLGVYKPV